MFRKILIANRGEIACRVIRSARALGLRTVAVYSDADRGALHARSADEAVHIGAAPPRESYLNIGRLIAACKESGADAVHPGYGFLSENAGFAAACKAAGIAFIGPSPEAIRLMGNKAEAKRRMRAAGVPCIPGFDGADQSDATLLAEAKRIGLPIMVKAAAGGGGRGMRRVADFASLPAALASARSEAQSAFGSGELILEKALTAPRHVEIQVFADGRGNVIHLGERDCSIQRRHQKVIEEAPSPAVSPELRERMGAAAVAAARAIDYTGAGTIEFLLDAGEFWFMEMNTRLQVEHAVTEMISGLDLVALQIRVAAGEPLPLAQQDVRLSGHAIEARLYAEDPDAGFLPQSGPLLLWQAPQGEGVRTDCGIETGAEVSTFYDPLLAKIVAHGATRDEARLRLTAALRDCAALGPATNKAFLLGCLEHPEFFHGRATTDFVAAHFVPATDTDPRLEALAAAALILIGWRTARLPQPWLAHWRSTGEAVSHLLLGTGDARVAVHVTAREGVFTVSANGGEVVASIVERGPGTLLIQLGALRHRVRYAFGRDGRLHLDVAGSRHVIADAGREPPAPRAGGSGSGSGIITPPMNGRIVAVLVEQGARVRRGQGLLVLESMKMEHTLVAPCDGTVAELACAVGEQVAPGKVLARIQPLEEKAA
jgi:geranyl-CoA carboxylase alpha subunit